LVGHVWRVLACLNGHLVDLVVNMTEVVLSEDDVGLARCIAEKRARDKEGYASTRRWCSDGQYHFHGILGELAYARHYLVDIDTSIAVDGDGGLDLKILGKRVDVKTSNYAPPILKLNSIREFKCDLLALARRVEDNRIQLCGFTDISNMLLHGYVHDFGHGARICIDPPHLFF
jgi:hypothetical protein